MINEEDFAALAAGDDPEMAFVRLEGRFRGVLEKNIEGSDNAASYNAYVIEYMNHTIAAARALGLDILEQRELPSHSSGGLHDAYMDFVTEVDHYIDAGRPIPTRMGKDGFVQSNGLKNVEELAFIFMDALDMDVE